MGYKPEEFYKPGEFSELSIQNKMKEWIESRQDRCNDPLIYDELPRAIKGELDFWIGINLAKRGRIKQSICVLKEDFRRETGVYIYVGVLAGAMMKAGYQPVNSQNLGGRFFKPHTK